jgi:hypothetical protein
MAVTLTTAGRNFAVDGVVDQLNNGKISWRASDGTTVLAETTLGANAFAAAASGAAALNGTPLVSDAATAAGTVALALFLTSGGAELFRCAVGTSGSDINLTSTAVAVGETITLNSLTYTQPA